MPAAAHIAVFKAPKFFHVQSIAAPWFSSPPTFSLPHDPFPALWMPDQVRHDASVTGTATTDRDTR